MKIVTNEENKKEVIIEATLNTAYSRKSDDGSQIKNTVNFSTDDKDFWKAAEENYEGVKPKWIPTWFKEQNYVKLSSNYNIPVRLDTEKEHLVDFGDFVARGMIKGAKIKIKLVFVNNAIYPSSFVVEEDGEVYDAFDGF